MEKKVHLLIICLFLVIYGITIFISNINAVADKEIFETSSPTIEFSEIQVNVSALGTFLRADPNTEEHGSSVQEPTIIDLEAKGLNDLKWISIKYSGEIGYAINKNYTDSEITLIGLFSSTSELKSIDHLNRVPGAINSGEDYKTRETYIGKNPTDISEDFRIKPLIGTNIEIPNGSKFLFLCLADIYYPDNSGTFEVTITKLELHQFLFSIENIIIILEVVFIIILVTLIKKRGINGIK